MSGHLTGLLTRHLWDPPWRSIKTLGGLRILGVSITALLSVPLLARTIATSREHIESLKPLVGSSRASDWLQSIADSLQLPLTIKLLVLSALCAVIGKAIYETTCPPYFRIGESYEEFRRKYSFAGQCLREDFMELWNETGEIEHREILAHLRSEGAYMEFIDSLGRHHQDIDILQPELVISLKLPSDRLAQTRQFQMAIQTPEFQRAVSNTLLDFRDYCRPWARRLCAWFFYVAIGFAGLAFLAQIQWVFRAMV